MIILLKYKKKIVLMFLTYAFKDTLLSNPQKVSVIHCNI